MPKINSGRIGEDAAVNFLAKKGYKICRRNFRGRYGEIDIIADDRGCTVFIEVKTRRHAVYGRPSEYVNSAKQERIIKTALEYTGDIDADMRFDVIEILYDDYYGEVLIKEINHIKNAF